MPATVEIVQSSETIEITQKTNGIDISEQSTEVTILEDTVSVVDVGFQGPQGVAGTDANYVHDQAVPATVWTVTHSLGKMPSVTIVDSAGTAVEGEVEYVSTSQVKLSFVAAFSGKAYFN